jgi:hypothetical protein
MEGVDNRSLVRVFIDTVRLAFLPVTGFRKSTQDLERIYHIENGRRSSLIESYRFSHDVASYNQGAIIEYIFNLAERHKDVRLALESNNKNNTQAAMGNLITLMNDGFFKSFT